MYAFLMRQLLLSFVLLTTVIGCDLPHLRLHSYADYLNESLGNADHDAVAMKMGSNNQGPLSPVVILSTAHPAKVPGAVAEAIGVTPPEPERLSGLKNLPERQEVWDRDAVLIKRFISSRLTS